MLSGVTDVKAMIMWYLFAPFPRKKRGRQGRNRSFKSGTITGSKDAITSTEECAGSMNVSEPTFVRAAGEHSLGSPVQYVSTKSPFNPQTWRHYLQGYSEADKILQYITEGVDLSYDGPQIQVISKSWPSAYQYEPQVIQMLQNDIERGRKAGPFDKPPFKNFRCSPLAAFQKRNSLKIRTIHDMSFPPGQSVNEYIDASKCSVKYVTVHDAVEMIKKHGRNSLMAKVDMEDAYKHIVVNPNSWHLLGSCYDHVQPDGSRMTKYYCDMVLPFGCKSSAALFNCFANGLEYIVTNQGVKDYIHYLDDAFMCASPNSTQCQKNLDKVLKLYKQCGFKVNPNKVILPTTEIEFLGIVIDSQKMQLRISNQRLSEICALLKSWENRHTCTKRQLLSLIGKLSFVSQVVKSGRTITRRLIELSKKAKYLHYKVRLDRHAKEDIKWWLLFLPKWNGISVFYDSNCFY